MPDFLTAAGEFLCAWIRDTPPMTCAVTQLAFVVLVVALASAHNRHHRLHLFDLGAGWYIAATTAILAALTSGPLASWLPALGFSFVGAALMTYLAKTRGTR